MCQERSGGDAGQSSERCLKGYSFRSRAELNSFPCSQERCVWLYLTNWDLLGPKVEQLNILQTSLHAWCNLCYQKAHATAFQTDT